MGNRNKLKLKEGAFAIRASSGGRYCLGLGQNGWISHKEKQSNKFSNDDENDEYRPSNYLKQKYMNDKGELSDLYFNRMKLDDQMKNQIQQLANYQDKKNK